MKKRMQAAVVLCAVFAVIACVPGKLRADSGESTRLEDDRQQVRTADGVYPYRDKADYVLEELDLKPGDVVVDIGAGDGWWSEKMSAAVGAEGTVHAAEVAQDKVDQMAKRFSDVTQVKPYLCPFDGTGLEEDTCDLAFLSKTYHHLDAEGRVEYLRHLQSVLKPNGRLVVIEQQPLLTYGRAREHGVSPTDLFKETEEADWVCVRYELMTAVHHYIAIFVQKDVFSVDIPERLRPTVAAQPAD